jgi:hypothetical protein
LEAAKVDDAGKTSNAMTAADSGSSFIRDSFDPSLIEPE